MSLWFDYKLRWSKTRNTLPFIIWLVVTAFSQCFFVSCPLSWISHSDVTDPDVSFTGMTEWKRQGGKVLHVFRPVSDLSADHIIIYFNAFQAPNRCSCMEQSLSHDLKVSHTAEMEVSLQTEWTPMAAASTRPLLSSLLPSSGPVSLSHLLYLHVLQSVCK